MGSSSIAWDRANEDLTQNATRRGVIQRILSGSGLGHEYTKLFQLSQYIILHLVVELFKEETSDFRTERTTVRTVHRRAVFIASSISSFYYSQWKCTPDRQFVNGFRTVSNFACNISVYTCRYASLFAFWWMKDTFWTNVSKLSVAVRLFNVGTDNDRSRKIRTNKVRMSEWNKFSYSRMRDYIADRSVTDCKIENETNSKLNINFHSLLRRWRDSFG